MCGSLVFLGESGVSGLWYAPEKNVVNREQSVILVHKYVLDTKNSVIYFWNKYSFLNFYIAADKPVFLSMPTF